MKKYLVFLLLVLPSYCYAVMNPYMFGITSAGGGSISQVGTDTETGLVTSTTNSVSRTVGSGSNRALIVAIAWYGADDTISSVVFNTSEAFTLVGTKSCVQGYRHSALYVLVNPTTTTANVLVTFNQESSSAYSITEWTGVDQITPTHDVVTASDETATPTASVLNVLTGEVIIDAAHIQSSSDDVATTSSNLNMEMQMKVDVTGGSNYWGVSSIDTTSTGTVIMGYTKGTTHLWTQVAAALNAN